MVILGGAGSLPGRRRRRDSRSTSCSRCLRRPRSRSLGLLRARFQLSSFAKIRPWRVLGAVLGGLVAFGLGVHAIVGAVWPRGTAGPISTGIFEFTTARLARRWLLRHWLVLPEEHLRGRRLPDRKRRVRDARSPSCSALTVVAGLVAVRAARADDLDCCVRLGDAPRSRTRPRRVRFSWAWS